MEAVTQDDLIGQWRAVRGGLDPSCLESVEFSLEFTLCEDGTASWKFNGLQYPEWSAEQGAPFPPTWDILDGQVLRVRLPTPLPRGRGQPEWTHDDQEYRIVWVTEQTLTVLGPFGGNMMVLTRTRTVSFDISAPGHEGSMPLEEYTLDQLARLLIVPRSEICRLRDTGRLSWHPDPATGQPRVGRDRLDAFLAANNMPPVTVMIGRISEPKQELANTERIKQELAKLSAEVRGQMAAMIERVRDEPDSVAALMQLLLGESDSPESSDS